MKEYEVIMKNGRPFLRHHHPIYAGGYIDRAIYGLKSAAPYVKWNWLKLELTEDMKKELREIQA